MNHLKSILSLLAFLAWGSLVHAEVFDFAIVGDAGRWNANSKMVRDSVSRAGLTRLVMPGDNKYSLTDTYDGVWKNWTGFSFDVVAIGNHNGGYPQEVAFFKMPGEYFSEKYGSDTLFLVLNSDNASTVQAQMDWLDKQLSLATEKYIFLMYHHPTYTVSSSHAWTDKKNFQLAIRPLLKKYAPKITAIIVGHDHLASHIKFGETHVILSGATQDVRTDKPVDYADKADGVRVKTQWYFDHQPYWVRLTVDTDKGASATYIRSKDDSAQFTVSLSATQPAVTTATPEVE